MNNETAEKIMLFGYRVGTPLEGGRLPLVVIKLLGWRLEIKEELSRWKLSLVGHHKQKMGEKEKTRSEERVSDVRVHG